MFYPSSMPATSHLLVSAERPSSPASSSASSSSSLPQQQQLCSSWEQGRCLRGTQCKYLHLGAPSSAPLHSTLPYNPLIASNTYPGFPASSASPAHSHLFSPPNPASSPSPPASASSLLHPFALADLDDASLDGGAGGKSLRRPMAALTRSMANLSYYGGGGGMGGSMGGGGGARKECWDWLAGRCQRGSMCKYMHAGMGGGAGVMAGSGGMGGGGGGGGSNDNVCHQWARAGQCQYGDVCKFAHISHYPHPAPHNHHPRPQPSLHQQPPAPLPSQQSNLADYPSDDAADYPHPSHPSLLPPNAHQQQYNHMPGSSQHASFPYLSTAASAPPIVFRDSRLGLDTEVCRFYAKHSRCKYSNACKFVHVHHGGGGVQVSGVSVTISELQRLCALHGPGGIASMAASAGSNGGAGMGGMGHGGMGGMGGGKVGGYGVGGGGMVGGYDKKAVMALEKEVRELRELKELHDREQRSQQQHQQQQQAAAAERFHPLLPSASFSSTFSSSSSSPVPQSSPAFSFASTTTHLTSSNKSTPPLGGGLNGSFSPSLLHLNGSRQPGGGDSSSKAVGSPLAFSSSSAASAAFASFQLSSAESAGSPSGMAVSSLFYSHSAPRSSLLASTSSAAELAAADEDDSQLIAGSTYAALSGSGALMKGRSSRSSVSAGGGLDEVGGVAGVSGGGSGVVCDHCGVNTSVWRDSYSNLCDECYTSLVR